MSLLTDIICTAANLVQSAIKLEAKAVLLKIDEQVNAIESRFKRIYIWCVLLVMVMISLLAGIGLIIAGVYTLLASVIGAGIAALIVGAIVSLLAAILMMTIKNSVR
jgi:predicted PurR-regulated permease PerM